MILLAPGRALSSRTRLDRVAHVRDDEAAFRMDVRRKTVETAYACFLLVRTLYRPRSHNIKLLRSLSEGLDKRLVPAWPRAIKKDRSRFELLKRAYVEARYSEHYEISADELETLTKCALELRNLVEEVCRERLEDLREEAEGK